MAIHTEYSVRMNSAYPPTTRRSVLFPASARKAPRRRRLATMDHLIPVILVTRCPVRRARHQPARVRSHGKTIAGRGGLPARRAHHRRSAAFHAKNGAWREAAPPPRHHHAALNPSAAGQTAPVDGPSTEPWG